MKVNRVNNQQPSFGMKYVKPRNWNHQILETLMDSRLVKEIDAKYPNAVARFEDNTGHDVFNNMSLEIELAKGKCLTLFNISKCNNAYKERITSCQNIINTTVLKDIEEDIAENERITAMYAREKAKEEAAKEAIFVRAEAENEKVTETKNSNITEVVEVAKGRTPFQKFICKIFGIK